MIPTERQHSVSSALLSSFGTEEYDDIRELTTGLSNALVYRISVQSKPYLLKIARTDALADPTLYCFACMESAAQADIAPKVWYTNIENTVSITDFIETQPFPIAQARNKIADTLGNLHSLTPFTKTIHSIDTANRFIQKLNSSKILPEKLKKEIYSLFEKILNVYPREIGDMVASHNDLKPENILYDGDRIWLVDWEAAFTNDRYSDLAIAANFVVANESDEIAYLNKYFNRDATEYEVARFYLMQQILHFSYLSVFLIIAANGLPVNLDKIPLMGFREYHDRMWVGKIDLSTDESKIEYALVHMDQLLINMRMDRFSDSLKIISKAVY